MALPRQSCQKRVTVRHIGNTVSECQFQETKTHWGTDCSQGRGEARVVIAKPSTDAGPALLTRVPTTRSRASPRGCERALGADGTISGMSWGYVRAPLGGQGPWRLQRAVERFGARAHVRPRRGGTERMWGHGGVAARVRDVSLLVWWLFKKSRIIMPKGFELKWNKNTPEIFVNPRNKFKKGTQSVYWRLKAII